MGKDKIFNGYLNPFQFLRQNSPQFLISTVFNIIKQCCGFYVHQVQNLILKALLIAIMRLIKNRSFPVFNIIEQPDKERRNEEVPELIVKEECSMKLYHMFGRK